MEKCSGSSSGKILLIAVFRRRGVLFDFTLSLIRSAFSFILPREVKNILIVINEIAIKS